MENNIENKMEEGVVYRGVAAPILIKELVWMLSNRPWFFTESSETNVPREGTPLGHSSWANFIIRDEESTGDEELCLVTKLLILDMLENVGIHGATIVRARGRYAYLR